MKLGQSGQGCYCADEGAHRTPAPRLRPVLFFALEGTYFNLSPTSSTLGSLGPWAGGKETSSVPLGLEAVFVRYDSP